MYIKLHNNKLKMGTAPCCTNLGITDESFHEANQQVILILTLYY